MMTARSRPVSAHAFRHTRRHIRRRTISCLVSYWSPRGRACGLGMGQSMRRGRECVLGLGPSILPGVLWSRRFLTSTLSVMPPCPYMVMPLARLLLSRTLLLPKARVGLSVLAIVNAGRVAPIVISWQNGMLRRRLLSSDSPGPLLESSFYYILSLVGAPSTLFPLNSVFPGGLSRPRD
jgi:hypothetical protein